MRLTKSLFPAIASALVIFGCCATAYSGDENPVSGNARNAGGDGNNPPRKNARIGNFRGGHLGASSFGDGSAPPQNQVGVDANPPSNNAWLNGQNAGPNGQPGAGGGFLGRYGGGGMFGGMGGGMPPNSDPTNSSSSMSTIGVQRSDDRGDDDGRNFPRRVGNTELRQWEVGANLPVDPSYAYWANWGTNMGLLAEFGWGYPFMAMGMGTGWPGMPTVAPPAWNGYGPAPAYGPGWSSSGNGSAPGFSGNPENSVDSNPSGRGATNSEPPAPASRTNRSEDPPSPAPQTESRNDRAVPDRLRFNTEKGEAAFNAGDYRGAVYYWKHAMSEDPKNGVLAMMYAQALFALRQYDAAASATQSAMRLLPADQWGVVITHRNELYTRPKEYLDQLLALDKAAKAKPNEPSLRFLAGFHYACLGYPKAAHANLEKALKLAPQDELSQRLFDDNWARLSEANAPPAPHPPADEDSPLPARKKSS